MTPLARRLVDRIVRLVHGGRVAPLSTYEVHGLAQNASVTVIVHALRRYVDAESAGPGDVEPLLGGKRETNPVTATLATTSTRLLATDPQRTSYLVQNLGANPVFLFFDAQVSATRGIRLEANGGTLIVDGDRVEVVSPVATRPFYFDRNPTKVARAASWNVGAAVRVSTVDWSYTVPAGRRAFLEFVDVQVGNDATVALNGPALARIRYTPSGGAAGNLIRRDIMTGQASIQLGGTAGGTGMLAPGDLLEGVSQVDNNAAGTQARGEENAMLTEFDA